MITTRAAIIACVGAIACLAPVRAQTGYKPAPENLAARESFQDARFGMFIHWGVYSVLGDGEWVMNNKKIPVSDYEKLPALFNPTEFNAAEWVGLAKAAGMKYITITSKHHDGFAMFDSKVSDYNIVARTPYKKDVLKALADECHRQGLKLFFYHSQLDWHNPDYFPRGGTGRDAGRPEQRQLAALSRLHERAAARAAHQLRRDRRHLVRRLVGQARRRLAARSHLRAHPPAAAAGADRIQPPPPAQPRRRLPDVREGSAGRPDRRVQQGLRDRQSAARDLRDDERRLGVQHHRPPLQVDARSGPLPGARRRARTRTSC